MTISASMILTGGMAANETMPSDGKVFDYYIENGRIKGIDGRNNVDFVITTDNNLIIGNKHHYLGNG